MCVFAGGAGNVNDDGDHVIFTHAVKIGSLLSGQPMIVPDTEEEHNR